MRRWRARGERGTAMIEVTWLSLLLLVPLVYIVLAVFQVQRSAYALDAATRAAGRAYSLAASPGEGAARARAAADVAMADQGLRLSGATMRLRCEPASQACLTPGSAVQVSMTYQVPLPLMPDALGGNTPSVRVAASQSVPYGTYREDRS